eukprot:Protomagalhaensia_sp_Gyna_25__1186@NODE_1588_length_1709_cov_10_870060_g1294_i0_p1_GENE_NODE_1588_length_1709_cov_10_870060_g1294_i0NODE_1588_length_1709_cov_10_870060_g1294_i0_p1_ORF_typecomplete_len312_score50_63_NODE_1588_length_1709_cov_10_870060_g1294_i0911026
MRILTKNLDQYRDTRTTGNRKLNRIGFVASAFLSIPPSTLTDIAGSNKETLVGNRQTDTKEPEPEVIIPITQKEAGQDPCIETIIVLDDTPPPSVRGTPTSDKKAEEGSPIIELTTDCESAPIVEVTTDCQSTETQPSFSEVDSKAKPLDVQNEEPRSSDCTDLEDHSHAPLSVGPVVEPELKSLPSVAGDTQVLISPENHSMESPISAKTTSPIVHSIKSSNSDDTDEMVCWIPELPPITMGPPGPPISPTIDLDPKRRAGRSAVPRTNKRPPPTPTRTPTRSTGTPKRHRAEPRSKNQTTLEQFWVSPS